VRLLPEGTTPETRILYAGRGLRAFADGFVSLLLPIYITALGFDVVAVGLISAATMLGSAALTIGVGFTAHRYGRRILLVGSALLMIATGIGFLLVHELWPLVVIAFIGTINPSPADVSVFYPLEQSLLAETVPAKSRTATFAGYALIGSLVAALGALAAGLPGLLQTSFHVDLLMALQSMFALYTVLGLITYYLYRRLPMRLDNRDQRPLCIRRDDILLEAAMRAAGKAANLHITRAKSIESPDRDHAAADPRRLETQNDRTSAKPPNPDDIAIGGSIGALPSEQNTKIAAAVKDRRPAFCRSLPTERDVHDRHGCDPARPTRRRRARQAEDEYGQYCPPQNASDEAFA